MKQFNYFKKRSPFSLGLRKKLRLTKPIHNEGEIKPQLCQHGTAHLKKRVDICVVVTNGNFLNIVFCI